MILGRLSTFATKSICALVKSFQVASLRDTGSTITMPQIRYNLAGYDRRSSVASREQFQKDICEVLENLNSIKGDQ